MSQQKRKRVEEVFGWLKTVGLLRKVKLRSVQRVRWPFTIVAAVYNLVGMSIDSSCDWTWGASVSFTLNFSAAC
ncbi:MAG: transposase [Nitrospira sp.]|nr:transposase [Nitrospira sp.]